MTFRTVTSSVHDDYASQAQQQRNGCISCIPDHLPPAISWRFEYAGRRDTGAEPQSAAAANGGTAFEGGGTAFQARHFPKCSPKIPNRSNRSKPTSTYTAI